MESFGEARMRLRQFLQSNGLPSHEVWVDWGDILSAKGSFYVYKSKCDHRAASKREGGIAIEAICTVNDATCCFVYSPASEDEARRLLIPEKGVKLSVP